MEFHEEFKQIGVNFFKPEYALQEEIQVPEGNLVVSKKEYEYVTGFLKFLGFEYMPIVDDFSDLPPAVELLREKIRDTGEELSHIGPKVESFPRFQGQISRYPPDPNSPEVGLRYNSGKLRWSLVDFGSLENMVKVLEFGANKYSVGNWQKGLYFNQICESLLRHVFEFMAGDVSDSESGLPLTGHILCNAMFLDYMTKHKPEFDDRFINKNKPENA